MTRPLTDEDKKFLPYSPSPEPGKLRPLAEIQADLKRRVHADFVKTKSKGGTKMTFIEWHTAVRILDKYAPGWQEDAVISMAGELLGVVVRIGLPTSDHGVVWRSADGQDEDEEKAYGEASNRAYSQALRRACAKFGLFLYAYWEK